MVKITPNDLGVTDIHSHSGGADLYNYIMGCHPSSQSVIDLINKAKANKIDNIVTFPMPTFFFFNLEKLYFKKEFIESGLEEFPYQISNKHLINEVDHFGSDAVLPFLSIHPRVKINNQIKFLERVVSSHSIYGLKLHTFTTCSNALSLINSPFVGFLLENNLPIMIHTGENSEFTKSSYVITLAEKYPKLRICLAHLGGFDDDIFDQINGLDNLFSDCSPFLTMHYIRNNEETKVNDNHKSIFKNPDPLKTLLEIYTRIPNQLLWGTDEPWTSYGRENGDIITKFEYSDECSLLYSLDLISGSKKTREKISIHNSRRFLFGE